MRRAARVDANQSEIVDALRQAGATVQPLHTVGQGVPDLLVGFRGQNLLLEVKTAAGKVTTAEHHWLTRWRGQAVVVTSAAEALRVLARRGGLDA